MGSSGREDQLALRARVEAVKARTAQRQQQVEGRRAARKVQAAAAPKAEVPSFALAPEEKVRKERTLNSTDVMEWFRAALHKLYGAALVLPEGRSWWTNREKSISLGLLRKYGATRLRATIEYFVATWPQRVELNEGRTTGMPTFRLMAAMREHIFNEASGAIPMERWGDRSKKAPKQRGEYDPTQEPKRGIGWDDD